jgi:hypothetical protein
MDCPDCPKIKDCPKCEPCPKHLPCKSCPPEEECDKCPEMVCPPCPKNVNTPVIKTQSDALFPVYPTHTNENFTDKNHNYFGYDSNKSNQYFDLNYDYNNNWYGN